jgi:hypothetical protein
MEEARKREMENKGVRGSGGQGESRKELSRLAESVD